MMGYKSAHRSVEKTVEYFTRAKTINPSLSESVFEKSLFCPTHP
jgi:hypothetical protein